MKWGQVAVCAAAAGPGGSAARDVCGVGAGGMEELDPGVFEERGTGAAGRADGLVDAEVSTVDGDGVAG